MAQPSTGLSLLVNSNTEPQTANNAPVNNYNLNNVTDNDHNRNLIVHKSMPTSLNKHNCISLKYVEVKNNDIVPVVKHIQNVLNVNNKHKTIRKSKKKSKNQPNTYGYEPMTKYRAKGNIKISKELTDNIVPSMTKEKILNLYDYMDKIIALQLDPRNGVNEFNNGTLKIINYDFHCKKTHNSILYAVININNAYKLKKSQYKWVMMNGLLTAKQIKHKYGIQSILLPESSRINQEIYQNQVENILNNDNQRSVILNTTKWQKIDVFNQRATQQRYTLALTPEQFKKNCTQHDMKNNKHDKIRVIPILMFDNNTNVNWIEYVWIVRIDNDPLRPVDIGISFRYNNYNNIITPTALHVAKDCILKQHQLVNIQNHDCKCLDNFQSNIDVIHIGNPDDIQNKLNTKLKEVEDLKVLLKQRQLNDIKSKEFKKRALYNWLKNINLEQYFDNLVNAGCDDLESLKYIKMNDLDQIGINLIFHKRKLMDKISNKHNFRIKHQQYINVNGRTRGRGRGRGRGTKYYNYNNFPNT